MPKYTRGRDQSLGMDIMKRISDGALTPAPSEQVEKVKKEITENCEELIEVGARIRPLLIEGTQVGWVRGLHPQERKMLRRWVRDPNDYVALLLEHATTFSRDEIEKMQAFEVRSLVEVIRKMGEYDLSLYPYLPAFVTTQASESLWYSRGEKLSSFEEKTITMPDGKKIRLMAPPNHARAWSTLCSYREQAKKRLEENMNALFIVRPWAGRSADPIANDLKKVGRTLETDSMEPWERIVTVQRAVNVEDGWGHPGDSVEDLLREMKGMVSNDRHERAMTAFAKSMQKDEDAKRKAIEDRRKARGITEAGITNERIEILTDAQVRARQAALQQGKMPGAVPRRESYERDSSSTQMDKFSKYR